ncbi:hypothetical protein [Thioflexithrix psekupsensis]|uniref:Uncharacterized protein n=1 Tax=Thioflexithrix psekupsensis TaxID=1570016 RepID=A0A251XAC4_9GAMM|nr:hypothetical protein [Thioflexithrix psekupsensis]OUD15381.1 hypothetical protein TPSD3_02310 [Thioflexithrix psekupsensis]
MLRIIEIIIISVAVGGALGVLLHRGLMTLMQKSNPSTASHPHEEQPIIYASYDNALPDTEELLIRREELATLTAIKNPDHLLYPKNYYWKQAIIMSTLLMVCLGITDYFSMDNWLYIVLPLLSSLILALLQIKQDKQIIRYATLIGLLKEVKNYNQIIQHIRVLDQLKAVGHSVHLTDRTRIIQALHLTRRDLVRALSTERIFRENPEFDPAHFEIDLSSLEALQVDEKTSEYSALLETALKVSVRLQEEMRKLRL